MKPPARSSSPRARDEAVARIRTITVGTAVAGLVGTGAFGALAAINYSGTVAHDAATDATTSGSSADDSTTDQQVPSDESTSGSTSSDSLQAAPNAVSTNRGAHVSSGGS
jgi:hypothetical protein